MCEKEARFSWIPALGKAVFRPDAPLAGSRRRRLWELPHESHCPVIGVCLPLSVLRQALDKALGGAPVEDDYELHVSAVNACTARNPVSERLQQALERRYAEAVQQFKGAKSTPALQALWRQAVDRGDVAGAFWASLTHPRCDAALQSALCREMHMIQHQAGAEVRIDRSRFDALVHENAVLVRELARVQERCTRVLAEKNHEIAQLGTVLVRVRGELIGKDSAIAFARAELEQLQASVPELDARQRLRDKLAVLQERLRAQDEQMAGLRRDLAQAREALAASLAAACPAREPTSVAERVYPVTWHLRDKTVLCVGGRSGNVANYRDIVEQVGARFAHHDGGLEHSVSMLNASLVAADLVICQTGCISHNTYWRVKDFCKRTGKRCLFVDNPSPSSLSRSLAQQIGAGADRDTSTSNADNEQA